ncbi:MAG: hypothetical protein K0Q73_8527, partial [Paenibacillus sp.]|nr:hypothetical protein [Paenibacillus sp.]
KHIGQIIKRDKLGNVESVGMMRMITKPPLDMQP